jgi:hypothetical protein
MKNNRPWSIVAVLALVVSALSQRAAAQCAAEASVYSFSYEGVRYEVVRELKSWTDAAACAVQRGGYLAQVDSAGEQSAIYSAIVAAGVADDYNPIRTGGGASYVWIGGTDRVTEGTWIWDGDNSGAGTAFWEGNYKTGAPVDGRFNNWGTDLKGIQQEPDDFDGQDAVAIGLSDWPVGAPFRLGGTSQWNDIAESSLCYFVVEGVPAPPTDLSITSITPPYGPSAVSDSDPKPEPVVIAGSGFVPDLTEVTFGGTPGAVASVNEAGTSMQVYPPALPVGTVTVTVTTPAGSASLVNGFRFWARPVVNTIYPASGPTAGGTLVTITGNYFLAGAMEVTIGDVAATVQSVNAAGTSLTLLTPESPTAGAMTVRVFGPGGARTVTNGFTYQGIPEINSVLPGSGSVNGGTTVVIEGANFVPGQTTVRFGSSPASIVTVTSPTRLTARTSAGSAGVRDVTVTTPAGSGVLAAGWTYLVAPTVSAVSPSSGPASGGTTITVTGTGFRAGATVVKVGGAPATGVSVNDAGTSLTAVTGASAPGRMAVSVSTGGGTGSKANAFTYLPVPVVSSVFPASGSVSGGTRIRIRGMNFIPGASVVRIDGRTCAVLQSNLAGTELRAVTVSGTAGPKDLTVTTVNGTSAPVTYTYTPLPGGVTAPPSAGNPRGASAWSGPAAPGGGSERPSNAATAPMVPAWAPDTGVPALDGFLGIAAAVPARMSACGDGVPDIDLDANGEPDLCQFRRGDLDLDGDRDADDVRWFTRLVGRDSPDGIGDLDGDGVVTVLDLFAAAMADRQGRPAAD